MESAGGGVLDQFWFLLGALMVASRRYGWQADGRTKDEFLRRGHHVQ